MDQRKQHQHLDIPIISVHGLKGSVLVDPEGKVQWFTPQQAAGISTTNLALPLEWENGKQLRDGLMPHHHLHSLSLIPYVLDEGIYRAWLEKADATGRPVYDFSYDWRRSLLETVTKFEAYIKWISAKHHGVQVQVMAHSMGGLITWVVLNRCPEVFHSVIFAGVPFYTGIGLLADSMYGLAHGLNSSILSPRVVFSFPSYYIFYPEDNLDRKCFLDKDGQPIQIDFYSVEEWEKHKIGIFSKTKPPTEKQKTHLRNCLRDGREFRKMLAPNPNITRYPPIAVLASDSHPTFYASLKDGPKSVLGYDFDTAEKQAGDGRVPFIYATPYGVPCSVFKTKKEHMEMLKSKKLLGILKLLHDRVESKL